MKYIFLLFLLFHYSYAHKINLFILNENENVEIYSYFASGTACKHCQLIIKNKDKFILKDVLDDKGKYTYKPTHKNIEVIVDAAGGHQASEKIEISNIQNEDLKEHIEKEQDTKNRNIFIGLILIGLIFFFLKKVKK